MLLADGAITSTTITGRINVNVAPQQVLACLGLEQNQIDKLIAYRQANTSIADQNSMAWVAQTLDPPVD